MTIDDAYLPANGLGIINGFKGKSQLDIDSSLFSIFFPSSLGG